MQEAVTTVPRVLQAQRLFGEPYHLLRVTATDLASLQEL
ncbi:Lrp/AsnC ligand binding domain-containing protein [Streptomyces mutabilis]